MANTHKFKVKNGLTTPNISFKDSNLGATITATMNDSTDTLSFEGNAGQLFSITDSLGGTLFAVSDISGIPSLEIDDQGIVRIAEFNGYLVVGGDSASATKGVTIQSGAISIRTDSSPGYVDFYCETNNQHRVRVKSPAHTDYSGDVDVTLPTSTGTLALTSQIPSTGSFITASSTNTLTNKTFDAEGTGNSISNLDVANFKAAAIVIESEGIGSNDNDTTLPTSAAVKDYVDNNAGGGTVTEAFKTIAVSGQSNVVADAAADTLTLVGGTNMTITTNAGGDTITFASSGGGGSGTPGGSNTQVQFNDAGSFGGNAGMTFNKTTGVFTATAKSFDIEHPTKEGMRLRYGSLEGPENGVYVRGRLKENTIILPDYWKALVDSNTITVELTPYGKYQDLYVESIVNYKINIRNASVFSNKIDCFYKIYGERKDIAPITVEYTT